MNEQTENTAEAAQSDGLALAYGSALEDGIWYQSFMSGSWYKNRNAAGSVTAVRVNGETDYAPVCDNCDQLSELDGATNRWQCFSEHCRASWVTILPNTPG